MDVKPKVHLATLTLERLQDFLACPWRYWKIYLERKNPGSMPHFLACQKAFQDSIRTILGARLQTGEPLPQEGVFQVAALKATDAGLEEAAGATVAAAVWNWWGFWGQKVLPLQVAQDFAVDLRQAADSKFTLTGVVPLVFRRPEEDLASVALPVFDLAHWSTSRLVNDPAVAWTLLGAQGGLKMDIKAVHVQVAIPDGPLQEATPLDPTMVPRLLATIGTVRKAIQAGLEASIWYPRRVGPWCSRDCCRAAQACQKAFGGVI